MSRKEAAGDRKAIKKILTPGLIPSPDETYGFNMDFLQSLNIQLPLHNKVFVSGLSQMVNESRVRSVFCLAGRILRIMMVPPRDTDSKLMAKIEFDHPVEAVQAVSMFHGQEYYGCLMSVQIDKSPNMNCYPERLTSIGRGLGPDSEPLKDIRLLCDIAPLKMQLTKMIAHCKCLSINPNLETLDSAIKYLRHVMNSSMPPLNIDTATPLRNDSQCGRSIRPWEGLLQPNGSYRAATMAAIHSQNVREDYTLSPPFCTRRPYIHRRPYGSAHDSADYEPRAYEDHRRPPFQRRENNNNNMTSSDTLLLRNLPRSVSLQTLNNQMRKAGLVKYAQKTAAGRAIVRYYNINDAMRCIKLFDRTRVDGQTIKVEFF